MQEMIGVWKPANTLPMANPNATVRPLITKHTPIEREGYLYKRSPPKSPMLVPTWSRRWCYIRDGKFGYTTIAKQRVVLS
jgi:hypothetical protein